MASIAIIDDIQDCLDLEEALLADGHACEKYQDPRSFLRDFKPGAFAVILTDLMMPYFTGQELLQLIREKDAHVPVIAVTAMTNAQRQRLIDAGFRDVLYKPILDMHDFRSRVYRVIDTDTNSA